MSSQVHAALPADGLDATWAAIEGDHEERASLRWDNEAWTVSIELARERVELVVRLSPLWQIRQFLLFRDLPEPDLWIGTDGHGRWGEVNGAHRPELDGAADLALVRDGRALSAFEHAIPIRRIPVVVGGSFDTRVLAVDVETLSVDTVLRTYRRLEDDAFDVSEAGDTTRVGIDRYGLPTDVGGAFHRTT